MTSLTVIVVALGGALALSDPQCLDESGTTVDWYAIYKLPREQHQRPSSNPLVNEGVAYAYMTSNSEQRWSLSERSIEDPHSMAGRTLAPLYGGSREGTFRLLYNDEHPDGNTSFTAGHTKGVVVLGSQRGFWLVHSVPKFPPAAEKYGYPRTGHMYGQTLLCVTIETAANAEALGVQLAFNRPYIYAANVPRMFATHYPDLAAAAAGKYVRRPPYFHVASLKSAAGTTFVSFAKHALFNKDLYADLVAPSLRVGLLVETWPNGRGRMNSSCRRPFIVENVQGGEIITLKKIKFELEKGRKIDTTILDANKIREEGE